MFCFNEAFEVIIEGDILINTNFPQRQNYVFQSFMQYGQRELGIAGLAKLDWASLQQQANALTLMKALNYMYFYGVGNLQNYGLINDPSLFPSLTPTYSWLTSAAARLSKQSLRLATSSRGTRFVLPAISSTRRSWIM